MLANPKRAQAVIVTLLEEMPVQETVEGVAALKEAGVRLGPVVANQVVKPHLDAESAEALADLGASGLASRAGSAGLDLPDRPRRGRRGARRRPPRAGRAADAAARAAALDGGMPVIDLPLLTGATFDAADLEILADAIALQVGEDGPRARGLLPHPEEAA
jgi:hypothetical protein